MASDQGFHFFVKKLLKNEKCHIINKTCKFNLPVDIDKKFHSILMGLYFVIFLLTRKSWYLEGTLHRGNVHEN